MILFIGLLIVYLFVRSLMLNDPKHLGLLFTKPMEKEQYPPAKRRPVKPDFPTAGEHVNNKEKPNNSQIRKQIFIK